MSLLDIIPGGSFLKTVSSAATGDKFAKAKISGQVGKVYYNTIANLTSAATSTAEAAKSVTTGIRNYALYAALAIAFVILWPLIAPMLANALQRRSA